MGRLLALYAEMAMVQAVRDALWARNAPLAEWEEPNARRDALAEQLAALEGPIRRDRRP